MPYMKRSISLPKYTLAEELISAISHGAGAIFSIIALVLMIVKANTTLEYVTVSIFGTTMIILYVISCVYHSLSPKLTGKKVLRVIDHCTVFLLVYGTYIPIALLGIRGALGWTLFGIVSFTTVLGITLSALNTDKFQTLEVICHLISGWSVLLATPQLLQHLGIAGVVLLITGGAAYSVGAGIYQIGKRHKYLHSIFHFFCLAGTILQWLAIYLCLL